MALRPDLEARVQAVEERAETTRRVSRSLAARLDEITDSIDSGEMDSADAIPNEVWDDTSVVRHTQEAATEAARVRRVSRPPPFRNASEYRQLRRANRR